VNLCLLDKGRSPRSRHSPQEFRSICKAAGRRRRGAKDGRHPHSSATRKKKEKKMNKPQFIDCRRMGTKERLSVSSQRKKKGGYKKKGFFPAREKRGTSPVVFPLAYRTTDKKTAKQKAPTAATPEKKEKWAS